MNRLHWVIGLLAIVTLVGCNSDIVCTRQLKALKYKCVYIEPIESQDPYVGKVLRDVLEKEFIRKRVNLCDPNTATIFITGSTFMTSRASGRKYAAANQAIESISVVAKDSSGQILLTASYDNKKQYSASKLAKEFGAALAGKLK